MSQIIVNSTYARYWHEDSGASGDESLYVGYHSSSKNYRSCLQFNTSSWDWGNYNVKDITILSATLELYPRGFYASSVRTADTWIAMNNVSTSGNTAYNNAIKLGKINDLKPLENNTKHSYRDTNNPTKYTFSKEFLTRLEEYCKANNGAGSVFSLFIGGVTTTQGVIFTGRNPSGVSKNLAPRLIIEYIPSASTGSITTSISDIQVQATVNITRNVSTYTHGIVWTINGIALSERSGVGTSNTFTIDSDSLVKKYFPAAATSINCSCKIITYRSSTQNSDTKLGEKSVSFALKPPNVASISWSTNPYMLADNSSLRYATAQSEKNIFIAGYSKPIINRGVASSKTGATISKYLINISSCGITETNLELTSSETTINKILSASASDRNFIVKIQIIDSRGKKSKEKQLFIGTGSSCKCYGYTIPSITLVSGPKRVVGFRKVNEGQTGSFSYNTNGYFQVGSTINGYNFDTTENEEGKYIYLKATFNKTSLNGFNKITSSSVPYYEQGDTTKEIFISDKICTKTESLRPGTSASNQNYYYGKMIKDSNNNITGAEFYMPANPESIYLLKFYIYDYPKYRKNEYTIYSASYIIHIRKGGKSLGLGAAAKETEETIYCGWDLNLKNPLKAKFGGTESSTFQGLAQKLSSYLLPIEGGTLTGNLTIAKNKTIYLTSSNEKFSALYAGTNFYVGLGALDSIQKHGKTYIGLGGTTTNGVYSPNTNLYLQQSPTTEKGSDGKTYTVLHSGNYKNYSPNLSELYYKVGDTVEFTNGLFHGYTTDSKKKIYLIIPLSKRLDKINSVTINDMTGHIRNSGGYAVQSSIKDGGNDFTQYTITSTIITEGSSKVSSSIELLITGQTWVLTNNAAVSFVPVSFKMTFA